VAATVADASDSYGGYGGGSSAAASPSYSGSTSVPGGYSQLQSFQDCQKVYNAAGMYDLARQCAQQAQDLGPLY
jgi:hypothetical protein